LRTKSRQLPGAHFRLMYSDNNVFCVIKFLND
jgi:hypothetical protein